MKNVLETSYVGEVNKKILLNTIYKSGVTSRSKLSRELSLSKPAVSDNLQALINIGIIEEIGSGESSRQGGRKPITLKLNETFKYIIAIDFNYEFPFVALANLSNTIVDSSYEIDTCSSKNPLSAITDSIAVLLKKNKIENHSVYCIAIACPGTFNEKGECLSRNERFTGLDWSKFDFVPHFYKTFGISTFIMNNINAATLGHWDNTKETQVENFLFMSCGIGLGAGIILDGKLFEGNTFNAGEIYNYIDSKSIKKDITIEQEIGIQNLCARCTDGFNNGKTTHLKLSKSGVIDFESIIHAYQSNDEYVLSILTETCEELCIIICNLVNFLPVEKVVLGGDYSAFGDLFIDTFQNKFTRFCNKDLLVAVSTLRKHNAIDGLLLWARNSLFDTICNTSKA